MVLPLIGLLLMSSAVTLYTCLDKLFCPIQIQRMQSAFMAQGQKISAMIATLISSQFQ